MLHGGEDYTCQDNTVTPVRGSQRAAMSTSGLRLGREIAG